VIFPEAASFPYLDALTTIMSFSAMWLMVQKKIESWIYWIIVDVIGIWLYFVKDVKFISLLYVILLVMAVNGLRLWHKTWKETSQAKGRA
jgi:nicotinamide mononucleotide transporter